MTHKAYMLILGHSGQVAGSAEAEDPILTFTKDGRRYEITTWLWKRWSSSTLYSWTTTANQHIFLDALLYASNRVIVTQIGHSNKRTHSDTEAFRNKIVNVVVALQRQLFRVLLPPALLARSTTWTRNLSIYCNLGCRSTVDFVGVTSITTNWYTIAITIASDGRKSPPYFLFLKGG